MNIEYHYFWCLKWRMTLKIGPLGKSIFKRFWSIQKKNHVIFSAFFYNDRLYDFREQKKNVNQILLGSDFDSIFFFSCRSKSSVSWHDLTSKRKRKMVGGGGSGRGRRKRKLTEHSKPMAMTRHDWQDIISTTWLIQHDYFFFLFLRFFVVFFSFSVLFFKFVLPPPSPGFPEEDEMRWRYIFPPTMRHK